MDKIIGISILIPHLSWHKMHWIYYSYIQFKKIGRRRIDTKNNKNIRGKIILKKKHVHGSVAHIEALGKPRRLGPVVASTKTKNI